MKWNRGERGQTECAADAWAVGKMTWSATGVEGGKGGRARTSNSGAGGSLKLQLLIEKNTRTNKTIKKF